MPKLRDLLGDVFEELFKFDSKVLRTVKSLVLHPGKLTAEYASGRRADYVAPFKLYFTTSFIFYLLMGINGDANAASWGMGEARGMASQTKAAIEEAAKFYFDNAAIFSILLLPLNGLAMALFFLNRRQPILLHMIATLHIWSGSVLMYLPAYVIFELAMRVQPTPALKPYAGLAYLAFMAVYQFFTFRRLFRSGFIESLVKSTALSIFTMVIMTFVFLVLMIGFVLVRTR